MMNYIRYYCYMFSLVVMFIPVAFFWLPFMLISRKIPIYTAPVGWWARVTFPIMGIKVKVSGKENIPKNQSFVLISNHQSFLDIAVLIGWVKPIVFFAKKELFNVPFFGPTIRLGRCISVDRKNPRNNRDLAERMRKNIALGSNYCVFPEGTRSQTEAILPFKAGIFKYLKEKSVPVLPVTISFANHIMPKKGTIIRSGMIEIKVHPLIHGHEYENLNVDVFKNQIYELIQSGKKEKT
jgi:1-acyl-sn-glycerol-3-phosphate acyltransferase